MMVRKLKRVGLVLVAFTGLAIVVGLGGVQRAFGADALRIPSEKIFVLPVPIHNNFKVIEVLSVDNPAAQPRDVVVQVPQGASDIQVGGTQYPNRPEPQSITIAGAALPAAQSSVNVSYTLPFDAQTGTQFTVHNNYDVDTAELYLPTGNYALSAEGLLTTTRTETVAGTESRVFTRLGIPSGDDWTISLQVLPTASATGASGDTPNVPIIGQPMTNRQNMLQAGGNLVLAALVLTVGLVGIRSSQSTFRNTRRLSKREALEHALVNLEYQFVGGDVDSEKYEKRKQEILERVTDVHLDSGAGRGGHLL